MYNSSQNGRESPENQLPFEPELIHIPAGEFWMDKHKTVKNGAVDKHPPQKVYLNDYWIGRYPVTVGQFAAFVDHSGYCTSQEQSLRNHDPQTQNQFGNWRHPHYGIDRDINDYVQHPVTMVSVYDAQAYCCWLSELTGKSYNLPSEEEWKKAALGSDERLYPWGDREPNNEMCNIQHWFHDTTPVGKFSPLGDGPKFKNPYGCSDLIGNVWEWTLSKIEDWYPLDPECTGEPLCYNSRLCHVKCGGCWRETIQSANRLSPHTSYCIWGSVDDSTGFRVVLQPSFRINFVKNIGVVIVKACRHIRSR
jgi:formylglycine-generating enzyme required for sulfatase activity